MSSFVCSGGEKVLMHFVQNTPGDNASLEDIAKALGISVSVQAGERPQVREHNKTSYSVWASYTLFPWL